MNGAPLMECGHTANARSSNGNPVCIICYPIPESVTPVEEFDKPSLIGRMAKCAYGDTTVPSDYNLAFFEFRGEGSHDALTMCANCSYNFVGHQSIEENKYAPPSHKFHNVNCPHCDNFTPHGAYDNDIYYCGCRGWD